jgi:hypothetical protein
MASDADSAKARNRASLRRSASWTEDEVLESLSGCAVSSAIVDIVADCQRRSKESRTEPAPYRFNLSKATIRSIALKPCLGWPRAPALNPGWPLGRSLVVPECFVIGLGAVISHGNPLGGIGIVVGGGIVAAGYHSLKHSADEVSADFADSLATFKFEQQLGRVLSEINTTSVRAFTPEELSKAKVAAESILRTGFLPFSFEQEAKKKDDEERRRKCVTEREDCVD